MRNAWIRYRIMAYLVGTLLVVLVLVGLPLKYLLGIPEVVTWTAIPHGYLYMVLLITEEWNQDTHMFFLEMIRSHWRGWNIVLFEDRGFHFAACSRAWYEERVSGLDSTCLKPNCKPTSRQRANSSGVT